MRVTIVPISIRMEHLRVPILRVSPPFPTMINLTLFDEDGNPVTNGVGKDLDNTQLPAGNLIFSAGWI